MKTANCFGEFHAPQKLYQAKKGHESVNCICTGCPQRHHCTESVQTKPVRKDLRPRAVTEPTGYWPAGAGLVDRNYRECAA